MVDGQEGLVQVHPIVCGWREVWGLPGEIGGGERVCCQGLMFFGVWLWCYGWMLFGGLR